MSLLIVEDSIVRNLGYVTGYSETRVGFSGGHILGETVDATQHLNHVIHNDGR